MSGKLLAAVVVMASLVAVLFSRDAFAVDHNFAGSAQLDYHFVPTQRGADARPIAFDGFTLEAGGKLAVDFSEQLSANLKVCYGCHGFETDMAYFEYRPADELGLRAGRFSPSFGNFNVRHDPANHRLSDKPLPYDMGRMLRLRAWNMGVLPSPFPDNGAEIGGKLVVADGLTLEYALYAVSGFKADANAGDLDFAQSRDGNLYYVDNNGRPTFGGRVSATARLGAVSDATLGASLMSGNFDPGNNHAYTIFGGDLSLRLERTNVRLEYLARRQEFDVSDEARFKYDVVSNGDFAVKHGAYVEIEQPLTSAIELAARADGMFHVGNVLATPPGLAVPADGELSRRSWVARGTLGATFALERALRIKASAELWKFSDNDAAGRTLDVSFHLATVGTF